MERATQVIGQSGAFLDALERASRAAALDRPVLVIGERGTGKELVAERLHRLSPRWDQPLIVMNCAALPETLIEAELFGHESGAFTGATKARAGRFEEAHRGTLFLDELGTLSMAAQERLLRAVEYGEVTRIGSSRPLNVDVRIVAATNEHLPDKVDKGTFRADLLDRLSFEVVTLPPLRARRGDIEVLAEFFGRRMAAVAWALYQHLLFAAYQALQPARTAGGGRLAQAGGAGLHDCGRDLRHARGGRAGARAVREDMGVDQVTIVDQREGVGEHRFVFGGEAGDQIGADRDIRACLLQALDQCDALGAAVAALHALEHHVVARLKREVDMRLKAQLLGEQGEQAIVDLDAVERGKAEALEARYVREDALDELAEAGRAGEVGAVAGQIDPGEDDLGMDAMIGSMTLKERAKPELLNAKRKIRVAKGSGTTVQDVNKLLKMHQEMQTAMKRLKKMGGLKGMLGMPIRSASGWSRMGC